MKNNNIWLTKLINQNSNQLKLNIDGSKLKLSCLRHENNNTWLTKLTKIIVNFKIGYKWIKSRLTKSKNPQTHSN